MDALKLENDFKIMYNTSEVSVGYRYWFNKLLNVCLQMFEYQNLPEGIPQRELELNLMITGHAVIIRNPNDPGKLFTPLTSIAGVDEYYQPKWAVFSNPEVYRNTGKTYYFNEDCVNIWNSSLQDSMWYLPLDGSMYTFITRYARELSDVESTISIYTVNSRISSIPVTDDNSVKESIKMFFKKLTAGRRAIITDSNIVDKFRSVDITSPSSDGINDWLVARDKILEQFYREIGIRMYNPKRAQVTESELESNDQLLLICHDDMLRCRREGLEKMNAMFDTNTTVNINPLFDITKVMEDNSNQEVVEDE